MSSPDAAAAILAMVRADTNVTIFDGHVPVDPASGRLPTRPYVVQWASSLPASTPMTVSGLSSWFEQSVTHTVVGDSAASVAIVARRIRDAVIDVVPDVLGRVSAPISLNGEPTPTQADEGVQPPVLYSVLRWACSSSPA